MEQLNVTETMVETAEEMVTEAVTDPKNAMEALARVGGYALVGGLVAFVGYKGWNKFVAPKLAARKAAKEGNAEVIDTEAVDTEEAE